MTPEEERRCWCSTGSPIRTTWRCLRRECRRRACGDRARIALRHHAGGVGSGAPKRRLPDGDQPRPHPRRDQERNIWVVGADERAPRPCTRKTSRSRSPGCWSRGRERRLTWESCDLLVRIRKGRSRAQCVGRGGVCLFESRAAAKASARGASCRAAGMEVLVVDDIRYARAHARRPEEGAGEVSVVAVADLESAFQRLAHHKPDPRCSIWACRGITHRHRAAPLPLEVRHVPVVVLSDRGRGHGTRAARAGRRGLRAEIPQRRADGRCPQDHAGGGLLPGARPRAPQTTVFPVQSRPFLVTPFA
jgi:CheY-like chemotaxis protein